MTRQTPGGGIRKLEDKVSQSIGQNTGQLNPDWVEWLMGFPIFWTSLEPMEELIWLDWSVDPADMLPPDFIGTPRATEAIRSDRFKKGRVPSPEEYVKQWPSQRAGNPGSRRNQKSGKILAEEAKKAEMWPTPSGATREGVTQGGHPGFGGAQARKIFNEQNIDNQGIIPRVATNIKDRANRLKAIGNGQVPQTAALAWEILKN